MAENLDILNTAVSLLIRAALLAARFSGRARQRSLQRLASRDVDAKAKEILFLKDRVYQLEMQVSILNQRHTDFQSEIAFCKSLCRNGLCLSNKDL